MCHLCGWLKLLVCLICLLSVLVNRFAYLFLKNVWWEKIKIQKRWLLVRLSGCSLFLSLFFVSLCLSFVLCSFFSLAGNVLQIGDGRAFQHISLFGALNFRLPQNCQAETKPRLLPMCCYTQHYFPLFVTHASLNCIPNSVNSMYFLISVIPVCSVSCWALNFSYSSVLIRMS